MACGNSCRRQFPGAARRSGENFIPLDFQPSTFGFALASSKSVGRSGGGLDCNSYTESFNARPFGNCCEEIRAALAGSRGGIEAAEDIVRPTYLVDWKC